MIKSSYRVLIVTLLIVFMLSGCASVFKRAPLSADQTTIAELRHRIEQNYLKFNSLKAKARMSIESPQLNFMANSTINLKKPDSIKIKLSVGFGLGVGSVFLDDEQFQLYNSFENTLYSGSPDSINFQEFFPVNINMEDFLQVFSGIQLLKSFEKELLTVDKKQFLVIGSYDYGVMKFWIDPKKYVVTKYQLTDNDNNVLIEFEYKNFQKFKNVRLPKTVRVYQPDKKTRLTLAFSSSEVNPRLKQNDFIIKVPDNVEKVQVTKEFLKN